VPRKVVLTPVMLRRNPVRMGCLLVHFRCYTMRIAWHFVLPTSAYTFARVVDPVAYFGVPGEARDPCPGQLKSSFRLHSLPV
jgi:hypothetical protein